MQSTGTRPDARRKKSAGRVTCAGTDSAIELALRRVGGHGMTKGANFFRIPLGEVANKSWRPRQKSWRPRQLGCLGADFVTRCTNSVERCDDGGRTTPLARRGS